MKTDLFPETLLVDISDGHTFTTSLKVAEHFHKNHQHVLRQIRALIDELSLSKNGQSDKFSALNFEGSTYKNKRGKSYPIYKISRDGFAILAMGFTGSEALVWKLDFLAAFNQMEAQLRAHVAREAAALHQLRPLLAPVVAGTEQGLRRAAIGHSVNRSVGSITYHRRVARRLGLLPIGIKPNPEQLAA